MKEKHKVLLIVLSCTNWIPIVCIKFYTFFVLPLIFLGFIITPVTAVIYIIVAAIWMLKKKLKVVLGVTVIAINLIFLLTGYPLLAFCLSQ